jgi:bis(5'-nucleosyl)-tetraphosphatase (symmetrical)
MTRFAVGDVQGCHATLMRLLARIDFDPVRDVLWIVGDLVNRGPASLQALRWAREQEGAVRLVLGNHDLHLLALAAGTRARRSKDTLDAVLAAPDRDELLDWLRRRPLIDHEEQRLHVHAGLLPCWSADEALALAAEAEAALAEDGGRALLQALASPPPRTWDPGLRGGKRLAFIAGTLTRLRTCRSPIEPCFDYSGPPKGAPKGCRPWFAWPERESADHTVVFGHWAALGLMVQPNLLALDTGCVWGRSLTAIRLDDQQVFSEPLADEVD